MARLFFKSGFLCLNLLLLSACAANVGMQGGALNVEGRGGLFGEGSAYSTSSSAGDAVTEIAGVKLTHTEFNIPVVKNRRVEFWVKYFSGRGRRTFAKYIERYGQMSPLMRPMLREANMPDDLVFLAMIESGFSNRAVSPANAVGPWQFIRGTGKMYGLKQDWWRDERRDPVKATRAAIRYLKRLYSEFGDWQLAAAAYNAGEGRIRNGIRRHKTRDYWTLVRKRAMRRETQDYVPKMMAAAIITQNARAFGFKPPEMDPVWTETRMVQLQSPEDLYSLALYSGTHHRILRTLNPELKHWGTPPERGYSVRLPNKVAEAKLITAMNEGRLGKYRTFKRYTVRRGDTLSEIADRYGVHVRPIMSINRLRSARYLRPGQRLILPVHQGKQPQRRSIARKLAPREQRGTARRIESSAGNSHVLYVVKKGDTLYDISRRYEVSVRDLKRWNSIRSHRNLRPGRQLRLYIADDQRSI